MRRRIIATLAVCSGIAGLALAPSGASASTSTPSRVQSNLVLHRPARLLAIRRLPGQQRRMVRRRRPADHLGRQLSALGRHLETRSHHRRQDLPRRRSAVLPDLAPSLTDLGYLRSEFTQHMPSAADNYIAGAAYDIWLNNWQTEVMIWVDNHRQTPFGKFDGTYNIYGEKFQFWQYGSGITGYSAFVLQGKQQTSGYVHVLSALRILAARHAIPADSTVTDLESGWEICSTNNVPLNFTLTNYAVWTGLK